uniref:Aldehyde dehydrogenase n=1 Tax=Alexandrium catenella TaxID=2925 RepID=A0A7S1M0Q3_ALECA|mmetsp:Transcript_17664/g.48015  ORF Transcript_17664/g.48015 Transcript_17664/m.48015 type:complete len:495 (+) Transcript_17664:73-1557(+)
MPSSPEAINQAHADLVATFKTGRTKTYEWRVQQLEGIKRFVTEQSPAIMDAIHKDLGRPRMEALLGEVGTVVADADFALANLKSWMQPLSVPTPIMQRPAHSVVMREPKGVVLAISPWNFPFNLTLNSIVAIVAAGNCCLVKPSEVVLQSEELLHTVLPRYVDSDAIKVVTGGPVETGALLKLRWDHIIYTGNGAIGRVVARAAAEHLTPTTLELGGKSPTVVLPGANLKVSARRILSTKCFNAGQICVAPDYALVHESIEEPLLQEMQRVLKSWYGDDASTSDSYGRIVNERHFKRVCNLIESADGEVLPQQGQMDEASKFIPPTLIRGATKKTALMEEEIFGPVLPVIKMKSMDEMIGYINAGDKPLALYVFGPEAECNKVINGTSSGGVCVNDTLMHLANPNLPFGGVGESGMGRYHGKWGFDEFSHTRGVMYRSTWLDPPQRYPPYNDANMRMMQKMLIGPLFPPAVKKAMIALGAAALAAGVFFVRLRV